MSRADTVQFRHNQSIVAAAVIAAIGALPLASARWYLAPVILVPLAVVFWGWRAGTRADARELRLRGLVGQRRIGWDRVAELFADPRGRGVVRLDDGTMLHLPAVRGTDLPRLVAVTGRTTTPADPDA
ncbi:chemotaxis protein CheW [Micromonospora rosaria]|uniref:Chemotaxis protein CheW n=1 Tax=Micromonospora rosaria TaxID=47874 RepID=A0A136PXK8_9ACTN|nr:PH domain-containing protein [Micromonospora rosaria]KXK63210.1 chemotaxis protein CheW [Micromonospora rosaria]